jgi:hypothetical protein
VCSRRYVVNVALRSGDPRALNPEAVCPTFLRPRPDPFKPAPGEMAAEQHIVVPGPKMHNIASIEPTEPRSGLTSLGTLGASPRPSMSYAPQQ